MLDPLHVDDRRKIIYEEVWVTFMQLRNSEWFLLLLHNITLYTHSSSNSYAMCPLTLFVYYIVLCPSTYRHFIEEKK